MKDTTMPFGKWKGCFLNEIPDDYLEWLLSGEIQLRPWLETQVEGEWARRHSEPARQSAKVPAFVDKDLITRIVKAGYRSLAMQCHPDRGGSNEEMTLINLNSEWLEGQLKDLLGG